MKSPSNSQALAAQTAGEQSMVSQPDDVQSPAVQSLMGQALGGQSLEEILIQTKDMPWREKSLAGVHEKMLFRNEETGASVALIRFDKGASIPTPHLHSSNQMMFCLQGKYEYTSTGVTLVPGSFYCNPKGMVHGPTLAHEETIVVEIYDGPHYPQRPDWYDNDEDAH